MKTIGEAQGVLDRNNEQIDFLLIFVKFLRYQKKGLLVLSVIFGWPFGSLGAGVVGLAPASPATRQLEN